MAWERPVTKVATELEISDVALHKICRKHNIPVPPRGYWAKLTAENACRDWRPTGALFRPESLQAVRKGTREGHPSLGEKKTFASLWTETERMPDCLAERGGLTRIA